MAPRAPTKYRGLLHGLLQGSYTDIAFDGILADNATTAFSACSHFACVSWCTSSYAWKHVFLFTIGKLIESYRTLMTHT